MFIARRVIQFAGPNGGLTFVQPGENLPDFATWPAPVRKAHLDLGIVEQVGGKNAGNLRTDGGRLYLDVTPESIVPEDMRPTDVTPDDALAATDVEEIDLPDGAKQEHCRCGRVFPTKRGLAKHQRKCR